MKIIAEDSHFQYGLQRPIRYYFLKKLMYPLADGYYHFLVWCISKLCPPRICKYYLSAVLIFKDEAPFLKEWLEYHTMLGVEHFYLYQNNSTDNYGEVLAPYLKKNMVTVIDWPEYPGQYSAYRDWYEKYRRDSFWVTFIDIDEFLCPTKETSLKSLLNRYDKYPVVLAYWKLFGTGGQMHHDYARPVIEQYTNCRSKLYTEGKIFYNTMFDVADELISMHGMNTRWGVVRIQPVNSFGKFVIWDLHRVNRDDDARIQVNHYWSKSYDLWKKKYEKGSIEKGTKWKDYAFFERLEMECTSCDYTIFRFLTKLKLRIFAVRM